MAPITESEWLAHTQSTEMLGLLRDRASQKDLWRFAVACCRRIWPHLHDERSRRAVEMAERDIDGRLAAEERLAAARGAARRSPRRLPGSTSGPMAISITRLLPLPSACTRMRCRSAPALTTRSSPGLSIAPCSWPSSVLMPLPPTGFIPSDPIAQQHAQLAVETEAEYAEQCHLLRGIFGYPFAV